MSDEKTLIYIMSQVFPDKFRYDKEYDELTLDSSFDLFKYPINLRQIFYKFYPTLLQRYRKFLEKSYDDARLEEDLIKDAELPFIPMTLIDTSNISERTFKKILSQDYDFMNLKDEADRRHFKFQYIVKYAAGVLGNEETYNINYYIKNGLATYKQFLNLEGVVDHAKLEYTVDYINANGIQKLETDELLYKFYDSTANRLINHDHINKNSINDMIESIIENFNNVPKNIYDDQFKDDVFDSIVNYNGSMKYELFKFLIDYFIRAIKADTYKYEAIPVDRKFKNEPGVYYSDNKYVKYVYDVRKSCAYKVAKLLLEVHDIKDDEPPLTNMSLLNAMYPLEECIHHKDPLVECNMNRRNVFDRALTRFDLKNPEVYEFVLNYATDSFINTNIPSRSIDRLDILQKRNAVYDKFNWKNPEIFKFITWHASDDYLMHIASGIIDDIELLKTKSEDLYIIFNYYNNDIIDYIISQNPSTRVMDQILLRYLNEVKRIPKIISKNLLNEFIKRPLTYDKYYKLAISTENTLDELIQSKKNFAEYWFGHRIMDKVINKTNFKELYDKYHPKSERTTLGFNWIKTYKEEPPFEIYESPNHNVDGETNSIIWRRFVNADTVPKEMVSLNYYNYMVRTGGSKKDPNFTILYTFFSNSLENKLIFCKSDIEFTEPAVERYLIPIEYDKVKPFLHEELETNNICMFCKVSQDDWNKIAGGNCSADIVCFSDCKNIYRERTPLKGVIDYIINMIQMKFDKECIQCDGEKKQRSTSTTACAPSTDNPVSTTTTTTSIPNTDNPFTTATTISALSIDELFGTTTTCAPSTDNPFGTTTCMNASNMHMTSEKLDMNDKDETSSESNIGT